MKHFSKTLISLLLVLLVVPYSQGAQSAETGFQINDGINDAWYNPDTAGQGFFINVFSQGGTVFLAWFTFDTERPANEITAVLGEPGHRWLTAFGAYNGNRADLSIEVTSGGIFNSAAPVPTQDSDGTITLEFESCTSGTITFDIPSVGKNGVIPIERLANDNVALCLELGP